MPLGRPKKTRKEWNVDVNLLVENINIIKKNTVPC
jgi:hypothetical protein